MGYTAVRQQKFTELTKVVLLVANIIKTHQNKPGEGVVQWITATKKQISES